VLNPVNSTIIQMACLAIFGGVTGLLTFLVILLGEMYVDIGESLKPLAYKTNSPNVGD